MRPRHKVAYSIMSSETGLAYLNEYKKWVETNDPLFAKATEISNYQMVYRKRKAIRIAEGLARRCPGCVVEVEQRSRHRGDWRGRDYHIVYKRAL